ncbi:MAG: TlpA family protein disulfide reductase [Cycloclasticus sp.]|jgi:peroxiredoxin|nr:MAG: redoxin [Cycloclasticus sp. Phe_18]MBV1912249.1 TlpA family protein disulfide reductase [Cycloclasticus sp.]MDF1690349.1 TlpA disulfide reductase family protein [Cycloclasticus sp.]MEE4291396.1 TlpA disulfide reductase family protein [Cycloclasticus sp.]
MKKNKIPAISLVLILLGFTTLYFNNAALNQVPNISVNTIDGEKIALSSLKGRPALVTFWATDCPGCIKEIPHLKAIHADYAAKGVSIIAIAMKHDRPDHVIAMAENKKLPYKIALDPMGKAAKAFGDVRLTPTTFLIAPNSTIAMQKLGIFDEQTMRQRLDQLLDKS